MDDAEEPRWLDPAEKAAWTGLISMVLLMPGRLEQPLHKAHGVTLFEYLVLSHVSETPEGRLRAGELAFLANGSLSRLSNVLKRLEQRDLVTRSPDPDNGRVTLVGLTDEGRALVEAAAPTHVDAVRRAALDRLTVTDQRALARIAAKLRIRPEDQ